jgi:hypothetical protein
MAAIPVLFCCDIEPEGRLDLPSSEPAWPGIAELEAWTAQHRPIILRATGRAPHFNWFLRFDPQVEHACGSATWIADAHRALWQGFIEMGDEIGVHVHVYRNERAGGPWFIDHGDQAWVASCIRSSIRAYERAFGRRPRSYRGGDRFLNNDTVRLLDKLGFHYDLSGEPGQPPVDAASREERERTTGCLPDYRTMPRAMYRPSRRNFLRPGRWFPRRIWMIPVSSGSVVGRVIRGVEEEPGAVSSLNLILAPDHFAHLMAGVLEGSSRPYLGIVCRSGDWSDKAKRRHMEANLAQLMAHPRLAEFAFVRPDEAVAMPWR